MTVLSLSNISVSFGAEDILEGISANVNAGDRIGLVGRNGAGKTTLLHVLAGSLKPNAGQRHVARGARPVLVEQAPPESQSRLTVHQEALAQLGDLLELEDALERAALDLQRGKPGAAEAYADTQERFERAGGFTYQSRLSQVLSGLGFDNAETAKPVATLSGGQRSRLSLAKALLAAPDLLLMDEPTNHLDFAGLQWLEDFLRRWQSTLIVTSHDRYFLDRVATRIWSIEGRHMNFYRGNYSDFAALRESEMQRQQTEHEAQREYIEKEEAFIRRYRAGQRAREARGRATRLARLERIGAPMRPRETVIKLASSRTGEVALATRGLSVGYGEAALLDVGSLDVERGAKVALIGPNGAGKTTLLRTLAGELPPVAGEVLRGTNATLAHYWQEAEDLNAAGTVLDELVYLPGVGIQQARDLLGMMLFSGSDVDKPVSGLSGGERGRLALAKLVLSRANVLLLDEPTNHLDIPSREALESALAGYAGTVIFASHDRRLISRLADRLWIVDDGKFQNFDGTFEEYQAREPERPRTQPPALTKQDMPKSPSVNARKRAEEVARIEAEIEAAEAELARMSELVNAASADGDVTRLAERGWEFERAKARVEALMVAWEAAHS
ncbi:MAG TPA: ABC-F family ATP-binding cassette domain-containing protein [Dehalococcoidia bacterium]